MTKSRSSAGSPSRKHAHLVSNKLGCDDFAFAQIIHHGFPYRPLCMAFDPTAGLLIVGTEFGYLRIYGREYVDRCFRDSDNVSPVLFVAITTSEDRQGKQSIQALSICEPSQVSLWELSGPHPCRAVSREFVKERFSCAQLSHSHSLLFFGTEAGNVYVLNARTLALSDQVIHWNRAVGPSFCNHPGPVVVLNTSPTDLQRVFIGYSPVLDRSEVSSIGLIVKWNLKRAACELVIRMHSGVTSMCWHFEGKSFVCGHLDGSISIWHTKSLDKPVKTDRPHGPISSNIASQVAPIRNIQIANSKSGELRTIFSGGIRLDSSERSRYLTVVRRRSTNVFQMDSPIVTMCTLYKDGPEAHVEPVALAILLEEDIRFLDLKSDDLVFLSSPHSSQFGRQTITFIDYIAAPPNQFYSKLLKLHNCQNEGTGCGDSPGSSTNFPLTGGTPGQTIFPYNEIIITGHANGSLCFWDCSALNLSPMYTISAERYLYPNLACASTRSNSKSSAASSSPELTDAENSQGGLERKKSSDTADDSCSDSGDFFGSPLAVESVRLYTTEPEHLLVVGAGGYVSLLKCNMEKSGPSEEMFDITVMELPVADGEKNCGHSDHCHLKKLNRTLVKVRIACRRLMGFHPVLVCLLPVGCSGSLPEFNDVAFNEEHGLLFLLVGAQLFMVDIVMETLILSHDINILRVQTEPLLCSTSSCQSPTVSDRISLNDCLDSTTAFPSPDKAAPDDKVASIVREQETDKEGRAYDSTTEADSPVSTKNEDCGGDPTVAAVHRPTPAVSTESKPENSGEQRLHISGLPKKTAILTYDRSSRPPRSISEKLKSGSLFRKFSAHTIKIMQHVEKSSQDEKTIRDTESDITDDQGVALLLSSLPTASAESSNASFLTVWLAVSSSRVFPLNVSISADESRHIKIFRTGDQIRCAGSVVIMTMIGIDPNNNKAAALEAKNGKSSSDIQPYILLASNNSLKVCCLPDRCCKFEQPLPAPIQAAWLPTMNGSFFSCTLDTGSPILRVYSIPRLDPLFQVGLPLTMKEFSCPLKKRLICGSCGMVCCLLNPLEISKMTLSTSVSQKASEMQASLATTRRRRSRSREGSHLKGRHEDAGRQASYSFLRIFASSDSFSEMSLFNSDSRKEPPGVLKRESRQEDTTVVAAQANTASSQAEASKMLQAGIERGQRLQQLDATTARMAEGAREFGKRARQLSEMQRRRSEKWWQLWR